MSGLGMCPACGKNGMIRAGADRCTRCERGLAESSPATVVDDAPVAAAATVTVASEPERRARGRGKTKPYVKAWGRVIVRAEPDED